MLARLAVMAAIFAAALAFLVACSTGATPRRTAPRTTSPRATTPRVPPRYYLSLGDSLAQGMEPDASGKNVNTNNGYPDQLYAIEAKRIPGLRLLKLGCGGENTFSMISGRSNGEAPILGCHPAGGSQLAAAEGFLRAHPRRGEVALVTLDIGANDLAECVAEDSAEAKCLREGVEHVAGEVPVILSRLRQAAPPGVPLVGMTIYDYDLSRYFDPSRRAEALAINRYMLELNRALERAYRAAGFLIAPVDRAFHSYDLAVAVAPAPRKFPYAVAEACRLTWLCASAPRGPNVHANRAGYGVIARTFAYVLGPLS